MGAGRPQEATPWGSVSVDIDTLADYAPGYGLRYTHRPDPVYKYGLPRFLELLGRRGVKATIFVIGRDAAAPEYAELLRAAVASGHELGNHTMTHPRRLASLPVAELRRELHQAHDVLSSLMGRAVVGFRAPCYDLSTAVLDQLRMMGYLYDSSILPTVLTPIIDLAVLVKSRFRSWEARPSTYAHVLAPLKPYRLGRRRVWRRGAAGSLVELPLTALPWVRLPFYGTFAQATGMGLFRASLRWLRRNGSFLNFHFHAAELIGLDDPGVDAAFAVHPGMAKPVADKRADIEEMLERFLDGYELKTLEEVARRELGACGGAVRPAQGVA